MRCTSCDSNELTATDQQGVRACGSCGGLFIGKGELDRLADPHDGDLELSTLDRDSFSHDDTTPVIRCPACDATDMKKVEFNIYSGLILDYCPSCGGFWLNKGELGRINQEIEQLNAADREVKDPPFLALVKSLWTLVK